MCASRSAPQNGPAWASSGSIELVDRTTRQLSCRATDILDELGRGHGGEHPKAKHELFDSCVEVITGVCRTVPEAMEDLRATVSEVQAAAHRRGLGVMCWGPIRSPIGRRSA